MDDLIASSGHKRCEKGWHTQRHISSICLIAYDIEGITFIACSPAVMPNAKLQEHTGSDKAWVWSCVDFAEGKQEVELFCIRFGSAESE
jgi:hypothetical protein